MVAAGLGLLASGALGSVPAQGASVRHGDHTITLNPQLYYHTAESCAAKGQEYVSFRNWAAYDCVYIINMDTDRAIFFLERER
ncbi:hypothetical protein SAMN05443668_103173 [Cryptosporangium aurantiacum]|uniref:Secreted protein n=1 Tax=Cryptosporangium aurantiacum TaxID=134849 RepID=A0A1M7PBN8_9ACTN|nr:hypothetical protein SAMN05443668_103173 [Cryptosporangium aurantiacum]